MFLLNAFNLNTNERQKKFVKGIVSENDYHGLREGFLDLMPLLTSEQLDELAELNDET